MHNRAKAFDVLDGEYVCRVSSHGLHKKKIASVFHRDAGGTGKSCNGKEYEVIIKAKSAHAYANDGSCCDSQNGYSKKSSNNELYWQLLAQENLWGKMLGLVSKRERACDIITRHDRKPQSSM